MALLPSRAAMSGVSEIIYKLLLRTVSGTYSKHHRNTGVLLLLILLWIPE